MREEKVGWEVSNGAELAGDGLRALGSVHTCA